MSAHHLKPIAPVTLLPYIGPMVCPNPSINVNTPDDVSVTSIFCFGNILTETLIITGSQVIKKKLAKAPFKNCPTHIKTILSGRNSDGPTKKFTSPQQNIQTTIKTLLSKASVKKEIDKLVNVYITPYMQKNNPIWMLVISKSSSLNDITGSIYQYSKYDRKAHREVIPNSGWRNKSQYWTGFFLFLLASTS